MLKKRLETDELLPDDAAPPDVAAIMRQIRSEVKAAYERGEIPVRPSTEAREIDSKDLHTANSLWDFPRRPIEFHSHRPVIGPLISGVKRLFGGLIRDRLLAQTFQSHYEFNGAVIRYLNQLNLRISSIMRRSADDLQGETYAIERRLEKQFEQQIRAIQDRTNSVEDGSARLLEQFNTLDSVVRGLERIAARGASVQDGADGESKPQSVPVSPASSEYLLLENRFRGSSGVITDRLRDYPQSFAGVVNPVLEIGAGRGELQSLFRAAGVPSYGIDLDRAMADESAAAGFDVRCEDALSHLRNLAPASLGGAIAIQVIEHLTQPYLRDLLQLLRSRIASGGIVIFETVNTASVVALTQNYLRDPTHVPPIHPESMRFIMELAGFEVLELKNRSPFPEQATLLPLPAEQQFTPGGKELAAVYNENIRRLNSLLFGFQDYSLTMRVPLT